MRVKSMRELVQQRLDALQISAAEAERRVKLKEGFLGDLLRGTKKSIRGENLANVALALECDPEFLTGHQSTPRKISRSSEPGPVKSIGEAETGVWRDMRTARPSSRSAPIVPDLRYDPDAQFYVTIVGDGAENIHLHHGMAAIVVKPETRGQPLQEGDIVLLRRWRNDRTEFEQAFRVVQGSHLVTAGNIPQAPIPVESAGTADIEIRGVAIAAVQQF